VGCPTTCRSSTDLVVYLGDRKCGCRGELLGQSGCNVFALKWDLSRPHPWRTSTNRARTQCHSRHPSPAPIIPLHHEIELPASNNRESVGPRVVALLCGDRLPSQALPTSRCGRTPAVTAASKSSVSCEQLFVCTARLMITRRQRRLNRSGRRCRSRCCRERAAE
jgi:hypothetical protein